MIGQDRLRKTFDTMVKEGLPPLVMLVGDSGMGKKLFITEFAKRNRLPVVMVGKTIKEIKAMAIEATKLRRDMLYVIPEVSALHRQAIAVFLKLTEEPPEGAHFIMLAKYEEEVPATILSRARVEKMDIYSADQLRRIGKEIYNGDKKVNLAVELVQTPGDIKKVLALDLNKLHAYVEKVVERLEEVQPANAFKTSTELAFSEKDNGWDVLLFMRMLRLEYTRRVMNAPKEDGRVWLKRIQVTSFAIQKLERGNVFKRMVYDEWVLRIRRAKK